METQSASWSVLILLVTAAGGWFIAARAAADAMGATPHMPVRRAVALCVPVFAFVLFAIGMDSPRIAVGVIFASCVAALTLVLGLIVLVSREVQPTPARRLWAFVLPAALIALMLGFSGGVDWTGAAILTLLGLTLYALWDDLFQVEKSDSEPQASAPMGPRIAQIIAAFFAAIVGAWAAMRSAEQISQDLGLAGMGLVAAIVLAPLLMPWPLASGAVLAREGKLDHAVSMLVAFVLLNLCVLLPLTTAAWLTHPWWRPPIESVLSSQETSANQRAADESQAPEPLPIILPIPFATWRIDTVLLAAIGFLLLPVALGHWGLSRIEGLCLLIGFLIYVVMSAVLSR